jgi:hypothetical protein
VLFYNVGDTVDWYAPKSFMGWHHYHQTYNKIYVVDKVDYKGNIVQMTNTDNKLTYDPSCAPSFLMLVCRAYNHDQGDEHED